MGGQGLKHTSLLDLHHTQSTNYIQLCDIVPSSCNCALIVLLSCLEARSFIVCNIRRLTKHGCVPARRASTCGIAKQAQQCTFPLDIRTLQNITQLLKSRVDATMAGRAASTRQHLGFNAFHFASLYSCFALAPQSLRDSLAQTYRTLHPNSTSSRWHHGKEQEQKQAECQEGQRQCRIARTGPKGQVSRTCPGSHHNDNFERYLCTHEPNA